MLKIGLIGCGMMGNVHTAAYGKIKEHDFKVIKIADLIEKKVKVCAKKLEAEISTFEDIINDPEIDIVDICVQTFNHKDLVIKAAEKGKNVFCEKPIALSEKDAKEMIEACKKNNVKLMVGHVVRFFPEYVKARENVLNGDIGTPVMARFYRGGIFPFHGTDNWFNDVDKSGGVFVDLSIHDLDYLRKLFGEIKTIDARSYKLSNKVNVDNYDVGQAVIRFESGAIVHVEGSWAEPAGMPSDFGTRFEITGKEGIISYDAFKNSTLKTQLNSDTNKYKGFCPTFIDPYAIELSKFMEAVINNKEPEVTGEEALEALKIALAANKSAKECKPIKL